MSLKFRCDIRFWGILAFTQFVTSFKIPYQIISLLFGHDKNITAAFRSALMLCPDHVCRDIFKLWHFDCQEIMMNLYQILHYLYQRLHGIPPTCSQTISIKGLKLVHSIVQGMNHCERCIHISYQPRGKDTVVVWAIELNSQQVKFKSAHLIST